MGIIDSLARAAIQHFAAPRGAMSPAFEQATTLNGPNYSIDVPAGFTLLQANPMGGYALMPPGSTPPPKSPAIVMVDPIPPQFVPMLMQSMYSFEDPFLQKMNAWSLGLSKVTRVAQARQTELPAGTAHIREFDAISMLGQPVRMMVIVVQGELATVKIVLGINLKRWPEFIGPCMELVGGLRMSSMISMPAQVRALVDREHPEQVEMQYIHPDNHVTPFVALPTEVEGRTVIYINSMNIDKSNNDHSVTVGDITGATGVAIGHHNLAKVS